MRVTFRPERDSAVTVTAAAAVPAPRTCAALLQAQSGQDFLKLGVSAQLGQLDVHAATQACSQVGRAGQDVAQMLVPHEAVVVLLKDLLDLVERKTFHIPILRASDRRMFSLKCDPLLYQGAKLRPALLIWVPPSAGRRRSA